MGWDEQLLKFQKLAQKGIILEQFNENKHKFYSKSSQNYHMVLPTVSTLIHHRIRDGQTFIFYQILFSNILSIKHLSVHAAKLTGKTENSNMARFVQMDPVW